MRDPLRQQLAFLHSLSELNKWLMPGVDQGQENDISIINFAYYFRREGIDHIIDLHFCFSDCSHCSASLVHDSTARRFDVHPGEKKQKTANCNDRENPKHHTSRAKFIRQYATNRANKARG